LLFPTTAARPEAAEAPVLLTPLPEVGINDSQLL
jgi:hypothetical protein